MKTMGCWVWVPSAPITVSESCGSSWGKVSEGGSWRNSGLFSTCPAMNNQKMSYLFGSEEYLNIRVTVNQINDYLSSSDT